MDLSLARVSRIVDALEKRGLIERARCPSDARATYIRITDTGRSSALAAQTTALSTIERDVISQLSPGDAQILSEILERITLHIEASADGEIKPCPKECG